LVICAGNAWAAPTPGPGGANQTPAVNGTAKTWLFNGETRVLITDYIVPDQAGLPAAAGSRITVVRGLAKNALRSHIPPSISKRAWSTPAGSCSCRFRSRGDFKPVKLILTPYDGKHKSFRIDISGIVKP
jgi:hypothetical protein